MYDLHMNITHAELTKLLDCNPTDGTFTWKISKQKIVKGQLAGSKNSLGYYRIRINGETVLAHRLMWFFITGNWPINQIDHINGNPSDNRFCNLREATHAENMQNRKLHKNNKSGYPGVFWDKNRGKWRAILRINRKKIHLGRFDTAEQAHEMYKIAKKQYHPYGN